MFDVILLKKKKIHKYLRVLFLFTNKLGSADYILYFLEFKNKFLHMYEMYKTGRNNKIFLI